MAATGTQPGLETVRMNGTAGIVPQGRDPELPPSPSGLSAGFGGAGGTLDAELRRRTAPGSHPRI
jgi:hypothetical protein